MMNNPHEMLYRQVKAVCALPRIATGLTPGISNKKIRDQLREYRVVFDGVEFEGVALESQILGVGDGVEEFLSDELIRSTLWKSLSELYEIILDFANEYKMQDWLRKQSWYPLLRLLRNGVSHTGRFRFGGTMSPTEFPIVWNSVIVRYEMDGMDIGISGFQWSKGFHLIDAVYNSVCADIWSPEAPRK